MRALHCKNVQDNDYESTKPWIIINIFHRFQKNQSVFRKSKLYIYETNQNLMKKSYVKKRPKDTDLLIW